MNNQEHLARLLLQSGADANAVDDSGHTPIDVGMCAALSVYLLKYYAMWLMKQTPVGYWTFMIIRRLRNMVLDQK